MLVISFHPDSYTISQRTSLGFEDQAEDMRERAINRLALYSCPKFKNGSDTVVCLQSEEYLRWRYLSCTKN